MALPLHARALEGDGIFCRVGGDPGTFTPARKRTAPPERRIPERAPAAGEQYRFHFDMTRCIGCHCCEVACNEQNNNPPHLQWRKVGELEGGIYPDAQRFFLSMGCNHCVEPSCLKGCPVDAYRKDPVSGLVLHNADACIGCQYCTWNCQYGVPQYNNDRGVVGKCDMCHGRLSAGLDPACVNACPSGAIQVELVNIAEWSANFGEANAPGMPPAHVSISTTRITQPEMPLMRTDEPRVGREHPHTPLIVMTVLMQLAVGMIATSLLMAEPKWTATVAFGVMQIALAASTLHLGRPIHAIRALRMWKRSWLSREVLLFTLFAGATSAYVGTLWLGSPLATPAGIAAAVLGVAGTVASSCIYLVPARPAWNMVHTTVSFLLTAAVLGPWFSGQFYPVALAAAAAQLANELVKYARLSRSNEIEHNSSARLLAGPLFVLRLVLLLIPTPLTALAAEFLGRYLFFVTVVPRNVASTYFSVKEAA
ncbi:MAG TPA: DmsC/YnfH family molybdoenzyme membrane anchor subunit [Bryobacteraceae bacterium]|nr:DmsC/YnfH family molybdoenzyme membrane anchor subunit [Bryobacteraceae bacterium]